MKYSDKFKKIKETKDDFSLILSDMNIDTTNLLFSQYPAKIKEAFKAAGEKKEAIIKDRIGNKYRSTKLKVSDTETKLFWTRDAIPTLTTGYADNIDFQLYEDKTSLSYSYDFLENRNFMLEDGDYIYTLSYMWRTKIGKYEKSTLDEVACTDIDYNGIKNIFISGDYLYILGDECKIKVYDKYNLMFVKESLLLNTNYPLHKMVADNDYFFVIGETVETRMILYKIDKITLEVIDFKTLSYPGTNLEIIGDTIYTYGNFYNSGILSGYICIINKSTLLTSRFTSFYNVSIKGLKNFDNDNLIVFFNKSKYFRKISKSTLNTVATADPVEDISNIRGIYEKNGIYYLYGDRLFSINPLDSFGTYNYLKYFGNNKFVSCFLIDDVNVFFSIEFYLTAASSATFEKADISFLTSGTSAITTDLQKFVPRKKLSTHMSDENNVFIGYAGGMIIHYDKNLEVIDYIYNSAFGDITQIYTDQNYIYAKGAGVANNIIKIDRSDMSIYTTANILWLNMRAYSDYIYISTGSKISKLLKNDLSTVATLSVACTHFDINDGVIYAIVGATIRKYNLETLELINTSTLLAPTSPGYFINTFGKYIYAGFLISKNSKYYCGYYYFDKTTLNYISYFEILINSSTRGLYYFYSDGTYGYIGYRDYYLYIYCINLLDNVLENKFYSINNGYSMAYLTSYNNTDFYIIPQDSRAIRKRYLYILKYIKEEVE